MELLNELNKSLANCNDDLATFALERFAYLIAPLAPHLGEECWKMLGSENSIYKNPPVYEVDKSALVVDEVTIVVQVNGKIRAKLVLANNSEEELVKSAAWTM